MKSLVCVGAFLLVGVFSGLSGERVDGPVDKGCASSGCHDMWINQGLGGASFAVPESGWLPGEEYELVVGLEDLDEASGVELWASAGELLETPSLKICQRLDGPWAVHKNWVQSQWNAKWRAPLDGDTVWFRFTTVQLIDGEYWTWRGRPYWKRLTPVDVLERRGNNSLYWVDGRLCSRAGGPYRIWGIDGRELMVGMSRAGEAVELPKTGPGVLFYQSGTERARIGIK